MTFELSDVKKVLDAFRDGEWDRIHLRDEDSELLLSIWEEDEPASGPVSIAAAQAANSAPVATTVAPSALAPAAVRTPAAEQTSPHAASSTPATIAGLVEVRASSMGIFWRSPSPGAPEFVAVGDVVDEDTAVCIVEVMKLMHRTTAGVRGVIHEVLVENGVPVAAGEPLFRIAPAAL